MEKTVVTAIVMVIVSVGYAQGLSRGGLIGRGLFRSPERMKFIEKYPAGTNEFGCTWYEQNAYEAFMNANPSGTNKFGRSFEQQREEDKRKAAEEKAKREAEVAAAKERAEAEVAAKVAKEKAFKEKYAKIHIKEIAGFRFGTPCEDKSYQFKEFIDGDYFVEKKLETPIRYFKVVHLGYSTNKHLLQSVSLLADASGVSLEDYNKELSRVRAIVEQKYGVDFADAKEVGLKREGKPQLGYILETANFKIRLQDFALGYNKPVLALEISVFDVDDKVDAKWDLPLESDADKF